MMSKYQSDQEIKSNKGHKNRSTIRPQNLPHSIQSPSIFCLGPEVRLPPRPSSLCPFLQTSWGPLLHTNTPPCGTLNLDLVFPRGYSSIVSRIQLYLQEDTMATINRNFMREYRIVSKIDIVSPKLILFSLSELYRFHSREKEISQ